MPDQPKPRAALHSAVPGEVREFVRCRRDSVDIAPELPDFPGFALSFEDGADGSITIRLDGPGEFMDSSISVSIQNGHLVADTSKVKFGRESVDKWIKDFNADLDAPPKKQLSGVSIKNGKLHVTKSPVTADTETAMDQPPMTPQEPSHHAGHPIPDPVAVGTPDDPSVEGPPPAPPPRHVTDPIPPPVKEVVTTADSIPDLTDLGTDAESDPRLDDSDSPTGPEQDFMMHEGGATHPGDGTSLLSEQEDQSGFIGEPPISDAARRARIYRNVGVSALAVIGLFLFGTRFNDTPVTPPSPPEAGAVDDSGSGSVTEEQPSEEQASDPEPVSSAVQVTDPAGDNGVGGTGADILGLQYLHDGEIFTALVTMGFSPLEATALWYSFAVRVTLITFLEHTHILLSEVHAGQSLSGEVDSDGNYDGMGVTLTDEAVEFEVALAPGDRVVKIIVEAFSLVTQEGSFAQDRMEVEVGTP